MKRAENFDGSVIQKELQEAGRLGDMGASQTDTSKASEKPSEESSPKEVQTPKVEEKAPQKSAQEAVEADMDFDDD